MTDLSAADLGFTAIPSDDREITPQEELDAAVASALAATGEAPQIAEEAPIPFGYSWLFDFDAGKFLRQGFSAVRCDYPASLEMYCLTALNSARWAHSVFTPRFGAERPRSYIGQIGGPETEADLRKMIRDAIRVHERVVDVTDIQLEYDPLQGVIWLHRFDVVDDEGDTYRFTDLQLIQELK